MVVTGEYPIIRTTVLKEIVMTVSEIFELVISFSFEREKNEPIKVVVSVASEAGSKSSKNVVKPSCATPRTDL